MTPEMAERKDDETADVWFLSSCLLSKRFNWKLKSTDRFPAQTGVESHLFERVVLVLGLPQARDVTTAFSNTCGNSFALLWSWSISGVTLQLGR